MTGSQSCSFFMTLSIFKSTGLILFQNVLVWFFHLTQLHSYFLWVLDKNVTEVKCLFCHIMWREYMISAWLIIGDICQENWKKVGQTIFVFVTLCILEVSCQFQPTLKGLGVKLHILEGGIYIYYLEFFYKENYFIILLLNMSVWPHKYLYIQL